MKTEIKRIYSALAKKHLNEDRQMLFFSGPRQVGKTTLCSQFQSHYYNWDNRTARELILQGEEAVARSIGLDAPSAMRPVVTFDEIHHYPKWKQFLKGFFDCHGEDVHIFVTGSARLNVYKKIGDSLMGRYYPYRMHPLSVGELLRTDLPVAEINHEVRQLPEDVWDLLYRFGGFPEPFSRADPLQLRRWQRLRFEQLMREDIRKDTTIRELDQLEALAVILSRRSGEQVVYSTLGSEIQMSEVTVRNWMSVLQSFFFGFCVRPWYKDVANSIRKTPKWYLRDWSAIQDAGKRHETMLACHLLKSVEFWTDYGLGDYELCYIRDKNRREVDFLVVKDGRPWILVESKTQSRVLSSALQDFQRKLNVPYAFQVLFEAPYEPIDCFDFTGRAVIVPARTFLTQLM